MNWIKVSDRLPDKEGRYMTCDAHGLHYMLDTKTRTIADRKLTILTIYQGEEMSIKLDRKMAKALIEEIKDICEMQWEGYI